MKLKTVFLSFLFCFSAQISHAEVYFNVAIAPAPNWANCGGCWDTPWRIGWPFYGYGYGPGYGFTPPAQGYQRPVGMVPYFYQNKQAQAVSNESDPMDTPDAPDNTSEKEAF